MIKLFLDIETTGFSRQWDNIIEIAAVLYNDETNTIVDTFHEYIKPSRSIPAKISELTGITNTIVKYCRSEKEVLMDFSEWVTINRPFSIIAHNGKTFDLQFIREKCNKYNITWNEPLDIVDTLVMARALKKSGKLNVENCQQVTLADYFEIEYKAHSAEDDVKALIKIYNKMQKLNQPVNRASLGF